MTSDPQTAVHRATAWKARHDNLQARAYAAHLRDLAATGREDAAKVRDLAAHIRADAALVRDDGARTRDDAARVRDAPARVRDKAALARDLSTKTREEALRRRLASGGLDRGAWAEILELDRRSTDQSREAANHDREAAELDRTAADKDRDAAERDRTAAARDREAADKDREASEKDRIASDADRGAADSDRKESERDLDLAEERIDQTERLAVLGRVVAGIAHEINNPLGALMATLGSMQTELDDRPATRGMPALIVDAQLASERIAAVMSEIKAWLYASEAKTARQPIDTVALVDDALRLVRPDLELAATLRVEVQPIPHLFGVRPRLAQLLTNLLVNAASAIDGPPEENEIRIRVYAEGTRARLEVRDTGTGIAPDVVPHIFDPFFTTHEGSGGMGLGLAMCERIVVDHAGTLSVETKVGAGSIFLVDLPCGTETSVQAPSRLETDRRPKVLVIDDDPLFTRSMQRLLAKHADVGTAPNGAVGLELLTAADAAWDLVLCDLMMPVMNGLELYERLRAISPARAAEVVFISGGATTDETAAFLASLPNVQLQKPFETARLIALLGERIAAAR